MSTAGLSKSRLERMHQVLLGYVERKEMPGLVGSSAIMTTFMWRRSAQCRSAIQRQ
jgi:hypothetical protein